MGDYVDTLKSLSDRREELLKEVRLIDEAIVSLSKVAGIHRSDVGIRMNSQQRTKGAVLDGASLSVLLKLLEGGKPKRFMDLVRESGFDVGTVLKSLQRAINAGRIVRISRGMYALGEVSNG